jgi:hypothetical protein
MPIKDSMRNLNGPFRRATYASKSIAEKGKNMNRVEMLVISAFWVPLLSFPAVDHNEWLPPDIVRDVARITVPANTDGGGRSASVSGREGDKTDVTKPKAGATKK